MIEALAIIIFVVSAIAWFFIWNSMEARIGRRQRRIAEQEKKRE